jgi:hypothetical protein
MTRRRWARARAAAAARRHAAAQSSRRLASADCPRARAHAQNAPMSAIAWRAPPWRPPRGRAARPARPACSLRRPRRAPSARARTQVLCFIDLGGHERVLKTAVYGLTCMLPDAVLLCISAARGAAAARRGEEPGGPDGAPGRLLPRAAREHLAVALALDVPLAVVVTQARLL